MLDQSEFEFIRKKHGYHASWAVWAAEGERLKDNVGDLSVLDPKCNPKLLKQLKRDLILVGLNVSRELIKSPLANFHDVRPQAMDYKIRHALKDSPFWGSYMTDIIKDFDQKESGKVMNYLRVNRTFEQKNIELFLEEMNDLGSRNPTIVAFGRDVYSILSSNLGREFRILKIPHYSNYGSQETYGGEVKSILGF